MVTIEAAGLVSGDILLVEEGDRLLRSGEEPIFARASPAPRPGQALHRRRAAGQRAHRWWMHAGQPGVDRISCPVG
jgi:hypothetical protein